MKISHMLCAMLAFAALTIEARAATSSDDGRASVPPANAGEASARKAPSTGGSNGRRAASAVTPRPVAATPERSVGPAAHRNPDRLQSLLLRAKAPGQQRSPPRALTGAATGNLAAGVGNWVAAGTGIPAVQGLRGAGPARQPVTAAGAVTIATVPSRAVARNSIGGPHAPASGRLSGSAIGPTARIGVVDGSQLHHKF
jgi:hypothetical protein